MSDMGPDPPTERASSKEDFQNFRLSLRYGRPSQQFLGRCFLTQPSHLGIEAYVHKCGLWLTRRRFRIDLQGPLRVNSSPFAALWASEGCYWPA